MRAAAAPRCSNLYKHVLEFFGWKVERELYFDSDDARGICVRSAVGERQIHPLVADKIRLQGDIKVAALTHHIAVGQARYGLGDIAICRNAAYLTAAHGDQITTARQKRDRPGKVQALGYGFQLIGRLRNASA